MSSSKTVVQTATNEQDAATFEITGEVKLVPYGNANIFILMDVSGSTGWNGALASQKNSAINLNGTYIGAWDHGTYPILSIDKVGNIRAQGGTQPHVAFTNPSFIRKMDQAGAIIMMTDGEIDQRSVEALAQHIPKIAHKPIIVLVTRENDISPARVNISVGAPFMNCPDVLLLMKRSTINEYYVINSKGVFGHIDHYKGLIDGSTSWSDFPITTPTAIKMVQLKVRDALPDGYMQMGNIAVHPVRLIRGRDVSMMHLATLMENITDLIIWAKTNGKIAELRTWLKSIMPKEVHRHHAGPSATPDMMRLMRIIRDPNSSDEDRTDARHQLVAMRHSMQKDAQAEVDDAYDAQRDIMRHVQSALAQLAEAEKATYSADLLNRLSNRARRAGKTNMDAVKTLTPDYTDAHIGECPICMEESPLCLVFREVNDVEKNTVDFALDFPLSIGSADHNRVLTPDVMCANCCDIIDQSPQTRENILITIPILDLSIANNYHIVYSRAAIALTGGIKVGNVMQLLYAVLMHHRTYVGFCDEDHPLMRDAITAFMRQLVMNIKTTDTFKEEGNKTYLLDAMSKFLADPAFHDYAYEGCSVMVRSLRLFNGSMPTDDCQSLMHKRTMLLVVQHYLTNLQNTDNKAAQNRLIITAMYDTRYSVPISGTAKLITDILPFIPVDQHGSFNRVKILVDPNALTTILFYIMDIQNHDSRSHAMRVLTDKYPLWIMAFDQPDVLNAKVTIEMLNKKYYRFSEKQHNSPILFANFGGPSVLGCGACGYSFLPKGTHDTNKAAIICADNRSKHMCEVFNAKNPNGNPDPHSGHYSMHRSARAVARDHPDLVRNHNTAELTRLVIEYVVTCNKRGNIYSSTMETNIPVIIESYYQFFDEDMEHPLEGVTTKERLIAEAKSKSCYKNGNIVIA